MKFTLAAAIAALAATVSAQGTQRYPGTTVTDTFAPVATGCSGVGDRSTIQGAGRTGAGQPTFVAYCRSQPGGYASIPGARSSATNVAGCATACNSYNSVVPRQYTCRAALYTTFDRTCQLLWKADGNISPRSDSDYLVASNY